MRIYTTNYNFSATPPKTEKSGFVRNSSIRLSDTRARRGIREPTNLESEKPKETAQTEVPAAQAIESKLDFPIPLTCYQN